MRKNTKTSNSSVLFPTILKEDEDFLVINKPAGWVVNIADTTGSQYVIEKWLMEHYKFPIFEYEEARHGIVHRIDKETSGALLIAKDIRVFKELQRQFKEREVQKTYIALAHGIIKEDIGTIEAEVGRLPWRRDRFGVIAGGRDSLSKYKVLDRLDEYTLVEVYPKTGRTHQIRIHLKYLGHPIVSDSFYAGRKTARNDRKWCPRLFLHASKIEFTHPTKKNNIKVTAPLAKDLESALLTLKSKP